MHFMHHFRHFRDAHQFHHHHGHRGWDASSRREALLNKVGSRLDLSAAQQAHLTVLVDLLQTQRQALKDLVRGPTLAGLLAGDNLDRAGAQQVLDAAMDTLRSQGPALVAALGDFFDSLDFEQQQALRFLLRRRFGPRAGRREA